MTPHVLHDIIFFMLFMLLLTAIRFLGLMLLDSVFVCFIFSNILLP